MMLLGYPLVMTNRAIAGMAIEIVDLASKNGDFQQQTVSLPEGTTIKKKNDPREPPTSDC